MKFLRKIFHSTLALVAVMGLLLAAVASMLLAPAFWVTALLAAISGVMYISGSEMAANAWELTQYAGIVFVSVAFVLLFFVAVTVVISYIKEQ